MPWTDTLIVRLPELLAATLPAAHADDLTEAWTAEVTLAMPVALGVMCVD